MAENVLCVQWGTFGGRIFQQKCLKSLIYLCLFSCAILYRKSKLHYTGTLQPGRLDFSNTIEFVSAAAVQAIGLEPDGIVSCTCVLVDIIVVLGGLRKLRQEVSEIFEDGVGYFCHRGAGWIENYCSLTFCIGLLTAFAARFSLLGADAVAYEASILTVTALAGWSYMLYFLLGYRLTG